MSESDYRLIYVTCASRDEALMIGRHLVERNLVACANVLGGVTSIFQWDGAVQEEQEVVLIAKTCAEHLGAIVERVRKLHSYTLPCVVALPIVDGNPAFLDWIGTETSSG